LRRRDFVGSESLIGVGVVTLVLLDPVEFCLGDSFFNTWQSLLVERLV